MNLLSSSEVEQLREQLESYWFINDTSLHCNLVFKDFVQAFAFMTSIAMEAEKLNHHPSWSNTYNKIDIELTTHEAGGLTALDFKLATIISEYYKLI